MVISAAAVTSLHVCLRQGFGEYSCEKEAQLIHATPLRPPLGLEGRVKKKFAAAQVVSARMQMQNCCRNYTFLSLPI